MSPRYHFDRLPEDVCERIVLHLTGGHPTPEALALARISPRLRLAVVSAVGKKFCMPTRADLATSADDAASRYRPWELAWLTNPDYAISWLQLLKDVVVDFSATTKYSKRLTIVEDLLKAPQLRKVHVFDKRTLFAALAHSTSIRELHVSIRSKKYGQCLFDALARMNVERLSFDCRSCDSQRSCPFQDPTLFNSSYNSFAVTCPNLKALQLWCTLVENPGARAGSTAPVWSIFQDIPTLKELTFNGEAPEQVIPHLRRLESVDITWAEDAYNLAMRVGPPVIGIGTHLPLSADMVCALPPRCNRLRRLAVDLELGAELALPAAFRELPCLAELHLMFDAGYEPTNSDDHNVYPESAGGALLSAVRAAPNLSVLKLCYVDVALDELADILTAAAPKLVSLTTSLANQQEDPSERLTHVLLHASTCCYNLEDFNLDDLHPFKIQADADVDEETADMYAAVKRLKRASPRLNTRPLRSFIADYTG